MTEAELATKAPENDVLEDVVDTSPRTEPPKETTTEEASTLGVCPCHNLPIIV